MLYVRRLIWDAWNVAHIARHEVSPAEVEEVCHGHPVVQEGKKGRSLVFGPTQLKRMITVVLDPPGAAGAFYVVTARPSSRREQGIYDNEKGKGGGR